MVMQHPAVGQTYKFNDAMARVVMVTKDYVTWVAAGRTSNRPRQHKTPRWYFEQHGSVLPTKN